MGVLKSVWGWLDDRLGLSETLGPMMRHPVPPNVNWWYVFGSATLFCFSIQVLTGIALATAYVPSAGDAYASLQFITHQAWLGRFLRGMHYFGASAMILFIGIHAIRVFLMGSYKFPREMSWLTGVVLLGVTVAMGFTGQLLRWDQTAIWSVIVGAKQGGLVPYVGPLIAHFILAGDVVGGATLSRFFAFHVFFIPAVIFLFVGVHLYLVLRNGISEPPQVGQPVDPKTYRQRYHEMLHRKGIPFWPDAAWRDLAVGIAIVVGVALLAAFIGPPELAKPPDPTNLNAYPRPDWYFLWYFAVLAMIPPVLEPYVIVLAPLLAGIVLVIIPLVAPRGERSPSRRPWAMVSVLLIVMMIGTLWIKGEQAPWSPRFTAQPLPAQLVRAPNPQVADGAKLFHDKGCEYCHTIGGHGGERGPDLTTVGSRLDREQVTIRILNGARNMPAFAGSLTPQEMNALVDFLETRKAP